MNVWANLKQKLNEDKFISRGTLVQNVHAHVHYETVYNYLDLLKDCGFIKLTYEYLSKYEGVSVAHYTLIRKIPKKLTIKEAKKMKHIPWLIWFKYPE